MSDGNWDPMKDEWNDIHYEIAKFAWMYLNDVVDPDLGQELWNAAAGFVIDELIADEILQGNIEVAGIAEDGSFTVELTEKGRNQV